MEPDEKECFVSQAALLRPIAKANRASKLRAKCMPLCDRPAQPAENTADGANVQLAHVAAGVLERFFFERSIS